MIQWPGASEWLFSMKTFIAAMLAVYIALAIGLDRPYWAMATVYIVSQPLTGALRSKALYRLLGTIIGAAATIALVPNLVDTPELLCAALALWTGFCLYIAQLDRTPRSYVFLLAGYTAAFIGFPTVTAPTTIWDVTVSRVEEIWLGIICASVVGAVAFPRPLGPLLGKRILAWVGDASSWAEEALTNAEVSVGRTSRLRLAADAVELRMLATHLAYDTSKMQGAKRWVSELQRRMVLLLPLLSSIADRVRGIGAGEGMTPALGKLLADMGVWVRATDVPPARSEAGRLREAIANLEAENDPRGGWNAVMRDSLLLRLRELVDIRQDMRDLRSHIEAGGGGTLATPLAVHFERPEKLHVDHRLALLSAFAAALTILLLCTFWIETGWQAGGGAAQIAAAACSLFAALDDPTPMLKKFLIAAVLSIGAVGIGLFAILPQVGDFEMLTLALGAFFVPVGVLMAIPATQFFATGLGFITATLLSLQSTYAADFVSYADGSIAALLGVAGAVVITALVRSVGAEWSARRLLRAGWRDLAKIPVRRTPQDRLVLAELLLDRIGLLVPRLAAVGAGNDLAASNALADVRVGINMTEMQVDREGMPPALRAALDRVLSGAAQHFAEQADQGCVQPPSIELLNDIDRALDAAIAMPCSHTRLVLRDLVGIRRGLFNDAPPYRPLPPDETTGLPSAMRQAA